MNLIGERKPVDGVLSHWGASAQNLECPLHTSVVGRTYVAEGTAHRRGASTDWRWVLGGTSGARARSPVRFDEATAEKIENFFRWRYRTLVALALFLGVSQQEAEDAVSATMEEMVGRWPEIRNPAAYARRAVMSNLIKAKERSRKLIHRLKERGHASPDAHFDQAMTIWENQQWVDQLLSSLPPAQREVLAYLVEGFKPAEVAILLGKTPACVRKNLQLAVERLRAREDLAGFRPANAPKKEGR